MIYEDILRELAYMGIYLGKNIGKVSRKEIYKLYRRYLKLYVLLPIKNPEFDKNMDYKGVKAINMLLTFGPKNTFSVQAPDLTSINEHIKELQNKIQKGR